LVYNKCAEAYLKEALEREGLDSVPEIGLKTKWMKGKFEIEVRAHLGNPNTQIQKNEQIQK